MRVIVVDDEPLMLRAFCRLCSNIEDVSVVGAFQSAEEALAFLENHQADVAFVDIVMPLMDGMEFTGMLQQTYPDLSVVFITAHEELMSVLRPLSCQFILKPYKASDIEEALVHLRRSGPK